MQFLAQVSNGLVTTLIEVCISNKRTSNNHFYFDEFQHTFDANNNFPQESHPIKCNFTFNFIFVLLCHHEQYTQWYIAGLKISLDESLRKGITYDGIL